MADDKDKVVSLVPKTDDKVAFAALLEDLHERAGPMARLRWAYYQAHLTAGFSPEQALILCQKVLL